MTQDEQEAVAGRVALEHAQLGREIATIKAELDRMGGILRKLGDALRMPEAILFDGAQLPDGLKLYGPHNASDFSFSSSQINIEKIKELVADLQRKRVRKEALLQTMKELGL